MKRDEEALPPVPSQVFSHLGPLPVRVAPLDEEQARGITYLTQREVVLDPDQSAVQSWQTYWHEAVHVALFDAGVQLPNKAEENVCDVLGTYLAAAVRAGFLKVQDK